MSFPVDLNDPSHARAYIVGLVDQGLLAFTGEDTALSITDEQALELAKQWFIKMIPTKSLRQ